MSANAMAREEMARERARIHRVQRKGPSWLERLAALWKRRQSAQQQVSVEEQGPVNEAAEEQATGAPPIEKPPSQSLDAAPLRRVEEPGWQQYKPWEQEEEQEKTAPPFINMATVRALGKKLMSREWARALGRPRTDPRVSTLEMEAANWEKRKAQEERLAEEARTRSLRQRRIVEEALAGFAQQLSQAQGQMNPEAASRLLEEAIEEVGEVFDIHWQEGRCVVWLEPWEEKRRRRRAGERLPIIYRAEINDRLELASYCPEDAQRRLRLQEQSFTKPLEQALQAQAVEIRDEGQAVTVLEEALCEIGRALRLERCARGWTALIEPWEEVRQRKIQRGGKGDIVTTRLEIAWANGRLQVLNDSVEEEEPEGEAVTDRTLEEGGSDAR